MDCGNPPQDKFSNHYQAGCLSFELISKTQKIICNTGYGKYFSKNVGSAQARLSLILFYVFIFVHLYLHGFI